MANVPESTSYDGGIYQLETVDEVLGGVNGKANAQAKGLANRTNWLKQQVDALNTSKGKGVAAFSAANSYVGGDQVIYQKNIWVANTTISPGAWNATQWTKQLGTAAASELADALPLMDGAAATGTSTDLAREDHVHPVDTSRAPLASPAFTGNPTVPTPAKFGNDTSIATTEFVQRALGNIRGVTVGGANRALTVADIGCVVLVSPGVTLTLPLANSVPVGTVIHFRASAGGANRIIAASGSDTVALGVGSGAAAAMQDGDTLSLVSNGGNSWINISGVAGLGNLAQFGASLAANGYQKLPSGLIVQWGLTGGAAQNVLTTVTLPIAFPTACRSVQLTYVDGTTPQPATRGAPVQVGSFGASSFQYSHAGSASGAQHLWTAIGC